MKAEILLQTLLAQGDLQDVDSKGKTDSKSLDDFKTLLIFPYDIQYRHTEVYLWKVHPINVNSTMNRLSWEKCINEVIKPKDYLYLWKR